MTSSYALTQQKQDKTSADCQAARTRDGCTEYLAGIPGTSGASGTNGGYAGRSGNVTAKLVRISSAVSQECLRFQFTHQ